MVRCDLLVSGGRGVVHSILIGFLCLISLSPSSVTHTLHFVDGATVRDGLHPIKIASTVVSAQFLRQATSAYMVDSSVKFQVQSFPSAAATQTAFLANQFDMAVSTTGFSSAQLQSTPQYRAYPFIGNAIVPIYNLPASVGMAQLVLPIQSICDILRGVVRYWNDSTIQAANPTLTLPNLGITVFHLSIPASGSEAVSTMCGKIDPVFNTEIPRGQNPPWPYTRYFAYDRGSNSDMLASLVIDKVGGFSMPTLQNVLAVKAKVAAIKNSAGTILSPTINAISLNMVELAVGKIPTGKSIHDLTDPLSPNAWPICTLNYIWLDIVSPVTTCATKAAMLRFVSWLYSSSSVKLLASALNMAVVPEIFVTATNLLNDLESNVICQGSRLISSSTNIGFVEGFGAGSVLLGSFFNYYKTVDSSYTYQFHQTSEQLSTQRVVAGEIDLALVNSRQLADSDINLLVNQAGGIYLPGFMTGVAVTFVLPTAISSKWATWTATSGLPSLYPLVLDLETVAGIFAGAITSWLHPSINATSPQLAAWFDRYPANPNFRTIVCCSVASEQPAAGILLMQALNGTSIARDPNFASFFSLPLTWTDQMKANNRTILLDVENRMSTRSSSSALAGESAISYRLTNGATSDQTTDFRIVQTVNSKKEIIAPEPGNFQACAQAGFAAGTLFQPSYTPPAPISGCYPLASPLALGANLAYGDTFCDRGNHSLNLFSWLINTDALSEAALNAGAYRIADIPDVHTQAMAVINTATCDGDTLLITLPTLWKVSPAIDGIGLAIMIIWWVVLLVSGIVLFVYRTRTVLRSSSVPFLAVILLGLAMFATSVDVWTSTASTDNCTAFMFLAPLGFSFIFVPFFAKTYRIYMIFSRKQLRVVKMSNRKLMIGVASLLMSEVILLIVWSQLSPLKPITYFRNVSGSVHEATHCSVDSEGMIFVVIETVYKACILLAGTMLAFSTRKVSNAFNESSAIAWSIYNVLFSSIIFGGIVYFVSALEDTLILLFTFLIGWVTFVTWCLLFGAKFYTLFSKSETEAAQMSRIDSLQTEKSQGFSFVSVAAMPVNLIKSYIGALEGQLAKARKELSIKLGTKGQGLGVGYGNNKVRPLTNGGGNNSGLHQGGGGYGNNFGAHDGNGYPTNAAKYAKDNLPNQCSTPMSISDGRASGTYDEEDVFIHRRGSRPGHGPAGSLSSLPTGLEMYNPPQPKSSLTKRPLLVHASSSTQVNNIVTSPIVVPVSPNSLSRASPSQSPIETVPTGPVTPPSPPSHHANLTILSTIADNSVDLGSHPSPSTPSIGTVMTVQSNSSALSTAPKPSSRATHQTVVTNITE